MANENISAKSQRAIEIGTRIKNIRKAAGLTQKEVADSLRNQFGSNVNKGMISKYENGIHEPSASMIFCLSAILNVSSDYLSGKSPMPFSGHINQGQNELGFVIKVFTRYANSDDCDIDSEAHELIPKALTADGRYFFGLKIVDNRYAPRFYNGDILIFEKSEELYVDKIMLVSLDNNDAFPCLVRKQQDSIWIMSLELEAAWQPVDNPSELSVLGAAVQIRRSI